MKPETLSPALLFYFKNVIIKLCKSTSARIMRAMR